MSPSWGIRVCHERRVQPPVARGSRTESATNRFVEGRNLRGRRACLLSRSGRSSSCWTRPTARLLLRHGLPRLPLQALLDPRKLLRQLPNLALELLPRAAVQIGESVRVRVVRGAGDVGLSRLVVRERDREGAGRAGSAVRFNRVVRNECPELGNKALLQCGDARRSAAFARR